ncbi:MAG TPA: rod shape-determining protein MreC [Cyclobacteriaceae bacterium]|nr:rod shape-determining protein MreC [Cyclobacteriaceae bacterium]
MERLFLFFFQYRAFFIFLTLEILCAWLIVSSNHYQSAQFFNSSNTLVANLNQFSYGVREYFSLRETNLKLSEENAALRTKLEQRIQITPSEINVVTDTALIKRFEFVDAKVVNNSVDRFTNFLTIDKGSNAGIEEGMAVISNGGAVGKVKATSSHYSVVTSILNTDVMVSAMLKRTGHFGTVQWDGLDPLYVNLNYIPRHVNPVIGDSIVTSGYNAIFPANIMIGTIEEKHLNDAALFYNLKVKLSQDFRQLTFVAVVKSNLKAEQDSLENMVNEMNP